MQDLAKLADTRTRPFLFQFVVSGPQIYAMVQVNGVWTWDGTVQKFLGSRHQVEEDQMFNAVVALVGGQKQWLTITTRAGGDTDPEARSEV